MVERFNPISRVLDNRAARGSVGITFRCHIGSRSFKVIETMRGTDHFDVLGSMVEGGLNASVRSHLDPPAFTLIHIVACS